MKQKLKKDREYIWELIEVDIKDETEKSTWRQGWKKVIWPS